MLEKIFFAVLIVLASLGLAELIHLIRMVFLRPHEQIKTFYVVMLEGGETSKKLEYVGKQTEWHGKSFAKYTVAAYDGLSGEETAECARAAKKYDMIYCPTQLLGHVITTLK